MSNTLIAKDRHGNLHEVEAAEINKWRVSVYGIVIKDGRILLVSERNKEGAKCYALPGGGMDFGERFEQTVEREVKEETGLMVRALNHVFTETNVFVWAPDDPTKRECMQTILVYYRCGFISGDISSDGYDEWEMEHMELAEWISLDRLASLQPLGSIDFRDVLKQGGIIEEM